MPPADLAILSVTHDSAAELPGWFEAVAALDPPPARVVVVDCASADDSVATARRLAGAAGFDCEVVALAENLGFTGGMNEALRRAPAPFVLLLNPDARPAPDYAARLLARLQQRPRAGAATGRLLRLSEPPRLDACGMRLTLTWRHLDRGSGALDAGQYGVAERVFGGTGAATLLRRAALDDVAIEGEIFDPRFHSFREDAELALRLAERGWEVIYEPAARAGHRRVNLPRRRRQMAALVNYHSLKNRYLLRIYHQTLTDLMLTLLPTLLRDLGALAYVVLLERGSLAAYGWLWRHRRELLARRRAIQRRRTRPAWEVARWFVRRGMPL